MYLYSWGRGEDGQLGHRSQEDKCLPTLVENLREDGVREIKQIACGSGHSVVLTANGTVFTWGRGDDGRLGHGDYVYKQQPVPVRALSRLNITFITCGSYHTAAVDESGHLFTWGGGMYGKLGHNSEDGCLEPRRVEALENVRKVACGSRHTLAIVECTDGGDSVSSRNFSERSGFMADDHLSGVHRVYAWGDRGCGVTGLENGTGQQVFPTEVQALVNANIKSIVACGFHSAALSVDGVVYTWGEAKFGRLGRTLLDRGAINQHTNDHADAFRANRNFGDHVEELEWTANVPTVVERPHYIPGAIPQECFGGRPVRDVACGGFHSAAITEDGRLYTWGGGEHGQLGHGTTENCDRPRHIAFPVVAGGVTESPHGAGQGLRESRESGYNSSRTGTFPPASNSNSVELEREEVVGVCCGWSHTVCLTKAYKRNSAFDSGPDGLEERSFVYSWGNGDHGKLGQGNKSTFRVPTAIAFFNSPPLAGSNFATEVTKLASYNEHTIAVASPSFASTEGASNVAGGTFLSDLQALREDKSFVDVVFDVKGELLYAHKNILSARCSHFKAMFQKDYHSFFRREADNSAEEGRGIIEKVTLGDESPFVFNKLLDYIYLNKVLSDEDQKTKTKQQRSSTESAEPGEPENKVENESTNKNGCWVVELYVLAEMYGLDHLKGLCEAALKTQLTVDSAANLLQATKNSGSERLHELCLSFVLKHFDEVSVSEGFDQLDKQLLIGLIRMKTEATAKRQTILGAGRRDYHR